MFLEVHLYEQNFKIQGENSDSRRYKSANICLYSISEYFPFRRFVAHWLMTTSPSPTICRARAEKAHVLRRKRAAQLAPRVQTRVHTHCSVSFVYIQPKIEYQIGSNRGAFCENHFLFAFSAETFFHGSPSFPKKPSSNETNVLPLEFLHTELVSRTFISAIRSNIKTYIHKTGRNLYDVKIQNIALFNNICALQVDKTICGTRRKRQPAAAQKKEFIVL